MYNSSEQLLIAIINLYEENNREISMIDCLRQILDETDLSEEDIAKLLDDHTKTILKENSAEHCLFRKSFYSRNKNVIDI